MSLSGVVTLSFNIPVTRLLHPLTLYTVEHHPVLLLLNSGLFISATVQPRDNSSRFPARQQHEPYRMQRIKAQLIWNHSEFFVETEIDGTQEKHTQTRRPFKNLQYISSTATFSGEMRWS